VDVSPEKGRSAGMVESTVLTLPNGQLRKVFVEPVIFGKSEGSQLKGSKHKDRRPCLTPGNVALSISGTNATFDSPLIFTHLELVPSIHRKSEDPPYSTANSPAHSTGRMSAGRKPIIR